MDAPNELDLPRRQLHVPGVEGVVDDELAARRIVGLPDRLVEHISSAAATGLLDHLPPVRVVPDVIVLLVPVERHPADAVAGPVGILVVAGQVVGVHPLGGAIVLVVVFGVVSVVRGR